MKDRKIKGDVLIGYMKFIQNTWGKDGLEELISAIEIDPDIQEGRWYDEVWSIKILEWIAESKGEEYLERSGRFAIMGLEELSHIVDFLDIKSILKRGSESYEGAFNDGEFVVELGEKDATIKIKGSGTNDKYACRTWIGVFNGMLEITNTIGTVRETQCERDGASHCEFIMEWIPKSPDTRVSKVR